MRRYALIAAFGAARTVRRVGGGVGRSPRRPPNRRRSLPRPRRRRRSRRAAAPDTTTTTTTTTVPAATTTTTTTTIPAGAEATTTTTTRRRRRRHRRASRRRRRPPIAPETTAAPQVDPAATTTTDGAHDDDHRAASAAGGHRVRPGGASGRGGVRAGGPAGGSRRHRPAAADHVPGRRTDQLRQRLGSVPRRVQPSAQGQRPHRRSIAAAAGDARRRRRPPARPPHRRPRRRHPRRRGMGVPPLPRQQRHARHRRRRGRRHVERRRGDRPGRPRHRRPARSAWMGDSGNSEGSVPHAHVEIHRPDGVAINPYWSLRRAQRDVNCAVPTSEPAPELLRRPGVADDGLVGGDVARRLAGRSSSRVAGRAPARWRHGCGCTRAGSRPSTCRACCVGDARYDAGVDCTQPATAAVGADQRRDGGDPGDDPLDGVGRQLHGDDHHVDGVGRLRLPRQQLGRLRRVRQGQGRAARGAGRQGRRARRLHPGTQRRRRLDDPGVVVHRARPGRRRVGHRPAPDAGQPADPARVPGPMDGALRDARRAPPRRGRWGRRCGRRSTCRRRAARSSSMRAWRVSRSTC